MAQPNAKQDQPTMDDILASIRRIIDDGNAKSSAKQAVANDDVATPKAEAVQEQPAFEDSAPAPVSNRTDDIGIPELDSFLESLDAKHARELSDAEIEGEADASQSENENATVVSLGTAATAAEPRNVKESKYASRFSETDRHAFAQVGNVLSAQTATRDAADRQQRVPTQEISPVLVSKNTRDAVGLSFEDLSAALMKEAGKDLPGLTEQMLKPMLSHWLDNNLPAMVERLVRSEIERIARGD